MHALRLLGGMVLALGLTSGTAAAQKILVPEGTLAAGSQVQVGYSNPNKAGETVRVEVRGVGFPMPDVSYIDIPLDGAGNGTVPWTVPGWSFVVFNAADAEEVQREIAATAGDGDSTDGS